MSSTEPTQNTHEPAHDETVIHVMTSNPDQQHYVSTTPRSSSSRKKRPALVVVLLLLLLGIGAYSFSSGNKPSTGTASFLTAAPAQVSITSSGFVPATVIVKVGQVVTWINKDSSPHWIASDPYPADNALAGFNAKHDMTYNGSFSFVFHQAGTYTYHDNLNPYTLEGTVVVE
jgi:plastocyanin